MCGHLHELQTQGGKGFMPGWAAGRAGSAPTQPAASLLELGLCSISRWGLGLPTAPASPWPPAPSAPPALLALNPLCFCSFRSCPCSSHGRLPPGEAFCSCCAGISSGATFAQAFGCCFPTCFALKGELGCRATLVRALCWFPVPPPDWDWSSIPTHSPGGSCPGDLGWDLGRGALCQ